MIWYVGYIVIALVMAGVMTKDFDNGKEVFKDVLTGLCWPVIIVMTLVWAFVACVSSLKVSILGWFNKGETK